MQRPTARIDYCDNFIPDAMIVISSNRTWPDLADVNIFDRTIQNPELVSENREALSSHIGAVI
jgi:hypothetical protein